MTDQPIIKSEHPRVEICGKAIVVRQQLDVNVSETLTPAEAIALGYALFSLGLHLKGK